MDFHSKGALTVYLLLADKKTNTKTTTTKKHCGLPDIYHMTFFLWNKNLVPYKRFTKNKQIKAYYMIL